MDPQAHLDRYNLTVRRAHPGVDLGWYVCDGETNRALTSPVKFKSEALRAALVMAETATWLKDPERRELLAAFRREMRR